MARALRGGFIMLPLWRELDAGLPMHRLFTAFLRDRYPLFLDSSLPHPRLGRYSYIMADPFLVLRSKGGRTRVESRTDLFWLEGDPFEHLRILMAPFRAESLPELPPFQGGAAGYFGYDLGQHTERLPRVALDDLGLPDMVIGLYDWVLASDHATARTWLLSSPFPDGDYQRASRRMEEIAGRLADPAVLSLPQCDIGHGLRSNFSREGYLAAVQRAKEYIAAGDIYQVNLSQRFQIPMPASPWALYCRLRDRSPVPFSAYLDLEDVVVASVSPELFLRKDGRRVETRPIKGTRPRGRTPEEDVALAQQLLGSEKDRAENVMIVDLLRNDLGKGMHCRLC